MKNRKSLTFLSVIMGLCIAVTSLFGTVALADGEVATPNYEAREVVDIAFFSNTVDYFTKDGAVSDLTATDYKSATLTVVKDGQELVEGEHYFYSKGAIIYGATGDYEVTLTIGNGTEDVADDVVLTAKVEVIANNKITADSTYVARYDVTKVSDELSDPENPESAKLTYLEVFNKDLAANLKKVLSDSENTATLELPNSFWNIVDLGIFESSQLVTKVYLAKPKTDFSVVNSSWKSELSKLSLSSSGTYAFYVEIKDCFGNEIVVDKETMELKENGWYLEDELVIPVITFNYDKKVLPTIEISAKQKTGIIGVEYNAGRITVENVANTNITLYYNANPDAKITGETAEERLAQLTEANGWKVATSEQATLASDKLSTSSLKFTPLVRGAFAYHVAAIGSDVNNVSLADVSTAISVTQSVQAQKLVNVKFRNFVKTNWLSLVFLGIAFLCIVGIIVLAFYKPKDAAEVAAKKASKAKVEDAVETPVEEATEVEEVEEAEEVVEELPAEETPAEEAPVEEASVEETPAEEAPAEEVKPEGENA